MMQMVLEKKNYTACVTNGYLNIMYVSKYIPAERRELVQILLKHSFHIHILMSCFKFITHWIVNDYNAQ